ncbi:protein phosphatase 2C domain-containing protein [Helicobacter suis]|uniref:protein phosphatase 2C domain-containing protein n=1 Tax=Helicobacter suis TaxID=104628 RepID=UPI0013D8D9AB|nr:protein phosphatase 2C domain-containing protein [Helicobacter suis]
MRKWGFRAFGASIKGLRKTHNQDAYTIKRYKRQLVAVVCDGLGSKLHSKKGSFTLCESVFEALKVFDCERHDLKFFAPLLATLWACRLYPLKLEDCLSTLQIAIFTESKIYLGKVGDGEIVICGAREEILREIKEGPTHKTMPFDQGISISWHTYNTKDIQGILLYTDGVGEILQESKELDFAKSFLKACKHDKDPLETSKFLKNVNLKSSDDKTLIALFKE